MIEIAVLQWHRAGGVVPRCRSVTRLRGKCYNLRVIIYTICSGQRRAVVTVQRDASGKVVPSERGEQPK